MHNASTVQTDDLSAFFKRGTNNVCLEGGLSVNPRDTEVFSTENDNAFMHYSPNHKQTSVFIKRFFGRWSYPDIAEAHDITPDAARKLYYAGVQKLLAVIIEMDAVKKMTPEERKQADVAKQKRYLEKNRGKVNARRRDHYRKNKDRINAKRRANYSRRSRPDTI